MDLAGRTCHASSSSRANRGRALRREPARRGLRPRSLAQDLLSLPLRRGSDRRLELHRGGGRATGRDHSLLADPSRGLAGLAPRPGRHRPEPACGRDRSRADLRDPGESCRSRVGARVPGRRSSLLSEVRLRPRPAVDRHAGRGSRPRAVARPRGRELTFLRWRASPRRRHAHRAIEGAARGSRAAPCTSRPLPASPAIGQPARRRHPGHERSRRDRQHRS